MGLHESGIGDSSNSYNFINLGVIYRFNCNVIYMQFNITILITDENAESCKVQIPTVPFMLAICYYWSFLFVKIFFHLKVNKLTVLLISVLHIFGGGEGLSSSFCLLSSNTVGTPRCFASQI